MSATYDLGDSAKLTFYVRVDGVLTNATVALTVTKPDGTSTTPSVTNSATGTYTATIVPDQAGQWVYRWTATGAATTAEDGVFIVEYNVSGTLYTSVNEVLAYIGEDPASPISDVAQIEAAIRASSRAIDTYCGRRFWQDPVAVTRTYRPVDPYCAWVDDISTTTGLIIKTDTAGNGTWATTWLTTDYQLEPLNASSNGGAYAWWKIVAIGNYHFYNSTFGYNSYLPWLQVTARFGWSQVPEQVRAASQLKTVSLMKRKEAPFGIASFGDFGAVRITRQDPDVASLLDPFRLPGFA